MADAKKRGRSPSPQRETTKRTSTSGRERLWDIADPVKVKEVKEKRLKEDAKENLIDIDLPDPDEDEDIRQEKLIEERRKRRMEILLKHEQQSQNQKMEEGDIQISEQEGPQDIMETLPTSPSVGPALEPYFAAENLSRQTSSSTFQTPSSVGGDNEPLSSVVDGVSSDESDDLFSCGNTDRLYVSAHPTHKSAAEMELLRSKDQIEQSLLHHVDQTQDVDDVFAADYDEVPTGTHHPSASDDDDMFAGPSKSKSNGNSTNLGNDTSALAKQLLASHMDTWDDSEGYYRVLSGEVLDERYAVTSTLGKGVFSVVAKAKDNQTGSEVAIKMIRNNATMFKAGQKELGILQKLMTHDPEDRKHIVRLLRSFEHRNHLCMVFESLRYDGSPMAYVVRMDLVSFFLLSSILVLM
jgi:serine/threonine-protein kinase PRP4